MRHYRYQKLFNQSPKLTLNQIFDFRKLHHYSHPMPFERDTGRKWLNLYDIK